MLLPVVSRLADVEHHGFFPAEKLINKCQDSLPQLRVSRRLAVAWVGNHKFIGLDIRQKVAGCEAYVVINSVIGDEILK